MYVHLEELVYESKHTERWVATIPSIYSKPKCEVVNGSAKKANYNRNSNNNLRVAKYTSQKNFASPASAGGLTS